MRDALVRSFVARTADETREIGRILASRCRGGEVFLLFGDLGAGKTTFVQGMAQGLGASGVTSPTFTLLHVHRDGRLPLVHADLYRLSGPQEVQEIGIEDVADESSILAVEWPDRLGPLTPDGRLEVRAEILSDDTRRIEVRATDERHAAVLNEVTATSGEGRQQAP